MNPEFSRRQLLAGLGAAGVTIGAGSLLASSGPAYTQYTYAAEEETPGTADRGLLVAWWESYNGQVVETQGDTTAATVSDTLDTAENPTYVPDAPGPIIDAGNVLPGDEGRLAIGLEAAVQEGQELAVWYRVAIRSQAENGVNEPERSAGDEPLSEDDEGELAEYIEAAVWEDGGLFGSCDGRSWPTEPGVASGSLGEVAAQLNEGQQLTCLESGETDCLGFEWALPTDRPNINRVQSDSVTFDIEFRTAPCDGSNPFDGEGNAG